MVNKQQSELSKNRNANLDQPETLEFVDFEESDIWVDRERWRDDLSIWDEAALKTEVESVALAGSYAKAVANIWRKAERSGAFERNEPCYIVELEANCGQFANWVLSELKRLLTASEWRRFRPVYLLTDDRHERVSECWRHPALSSWVESGNLEPIEFDVRHQNYLDLISRRVILGPNSIANPLVVIANGVFSGMRQSLYQVHYGRCFSAQIALKEHSSLRGGRRESKPPTIDINYNWLEVANPESEHALLPYYLERLDAGTVIIPSGALRAIDNIREISANECLILSSDRGFYTELDLRQQECPQFSLTPNFFLPLNGHALTQAVKRHGGNTAHSQRAKDVGLNSVFWYPKGNSASFITASDLVFFFHDNHDVTARRLTQLALKAEEHLNADQVLSLLALSHYDHTVLFTHLRCIFTELPYFDANQRSCWQEAVVRVYQQYYLLVEDAECLLDLGVLAMNLGVWHVAKDVFEVIAEHYPDDEQSRFFLASSYLQLGLRHDAKRVISQASRLSPQSNDIAKLEEDIDRWIEACDNDVCYDWDLAVDGELSLHPFAGHHTESLLYQYRDPSIAVMTSLPNYENQTEFAKWLGKRNKLERHAMYSVIHRDYGFIGIVSLRWHEDSAFFYFWIGVDFQRRGFGQRAANLLFRMTGKTLEITHFSTCAYKDNSRSLAALTRLGFQRLTYVAKEPNQDLYFFNRSDNGANEELSQIRFTKLLKNIDSPIILNDSNPNTSLSSVTLNG